MSKITTRTKEILIVLKTGKYSLREIGGKYNLTRERIRQIYKNATGKGYKKNLEFKRREALKKEIILGNKVKYFCNACHTPVLEKDSYYLKSLCRNCNILENNNRDIYVFKVCQVCRKPFHPSRNIKYPSQKGKGIFCTQKCYLSSSTFKNLDQFRKNRRKYSDEFLIYVLRQFFNHYHRVPKYYEFRHKNPSACTISNRFNGWTKALEKAGLV